MKIHAYLDLFNINSKSFLLLSITPKGQYPLKSYGNEFDRYVENIFSTEKYIGLFDPNRKEILQDVAFKIYTMPLIGDTYKIQYREHKRLPRANKKEIEAFIVLKEFYNTVPSGELTEEASIESGQRKAKTFIDRYDPDEYEIVITKHSRDEDGVAYLYDMEFDVEGKDFVFDYVYCN